MTVELLVIVAILVEAIVETLKLIYDKANRSVDTAVILALVVAIGVSVICRLGLFGLVGVTMPWVADAICTGVIISRGSNYLHTLLAKRKDIFIAVDNSTEDNVSGK